MAVVVREGLAPKKGGNVLLGRQDRLKKEARCFYGLEEGIIALQSVSDRLKALKGGVVAFGAKIGYMAATTGKSRGTASARLRDRCPSRGG